MFHQEKGKWRKCKPSDTNKRAADGDRNERRQNDRWGNTEMPGAFASGVRWCGQQKYVRDYLTVWSMTFFKQYLPQSCETCTPGLRNMESAECHTAPKKTATGPRARCQRVGNTALKTLNYFKSCTGHLLLFCTMTNKCTIISQIMTLLHVSTLSCHPQGACNQYLAMLHKHFKCSCW